MDFEEAKNISVKKLEQVITELDVFLDIFLEAKEKCLDANNKHNAESLDYWLSWCIDRLNNNSDPAIKIYFNDESKPKGDCNKYDTKQNLLSCMLNMKE